MRIDPKVATQPIQQRETREQAPLAKSSDAPTGAAVVTLSSAGSAAAAEAAPAAQATTTSRLDTIRSLLDKGHYPVDLDVLATRIVDDEFIRAGRS